MYEHCVQTLCINMTLLWAFSITTQNLKHTSATVFLVQPVYQFGHPENYLCVLDKTILIGTKYPQPILFNLEKENWSDTDSETVVCSNMGAIFVLTRCVNQCCRFSRNIA